MIPSAILDLQWMIGNVIMGSVAMLVRDWTHLNMAMSIPLLVTFPVVWMFTPESPSWLVSKGRLKEAAKITSKGAKLNSKPLSYDQAVLIVGEMAQNINKDAQHQSSYFQSLLAILKHPSTR